MNSTWTPDRDTQLRDQWSAGVPISKIGRDLGVTKASIVGRVHRLGLPSRESPIHGQPVAEPKVPVRLSKEALPVMRPIMMEILGLTEAHRKILTGE